MYELIYTTQNGALQVERADTLEEVSTLAWLTVAIQGGNPLQVRKDGQVLWDIDFVGLRDVLQRQAQEAGRVARSMSALAAHEMEV